MRCVCINNYMKKKLLKDKSDFDKIIGWEEYDIELYNKVEKIYEANRKILRGQEIRFLIGLIKYGLYDVERRFDEYMKLSGEGRRGITKDGLLLRYGDVEGMRRWNEYCKKQSITNTYEYKRDKYGWSKQEFDEYNNSRAVTEENLIKRHGEEEGLKKFNDYKKRQAYAGCKLEYFIEKYGKDEGERRYLDLCKQKVLSSDNFVRKYGKKLGEQKYLNYIKNKRPEFYYSKMSQECFHIICDNLPENRREFIFYGEKNYEYLFHKSGNNAIFVDFYDSLNKKIIEFHGNYWHCNPTMYDENYFHTVRNMYAKEIWESDMIRKEFLMKNFDVEYMVIWEYDYKNNQDEALKEVKKYLL